MSKEEREVIEAAVAWMEDPGADQHTTCGDDRCVECSRLFRLAYKVNAYKRKLRLEK